MNPKPADTVALGPSRWRLWRTMVLRSAGFPISDVLALGDPGLAGVVDAGPGGDAAIAAAFDASLARGVANLRRLIRDGRLYEALLWQNRGFANRAQSLFGEGAPDHARNQSFRRTESTLIGYLQRYSAKNDTIGFFGPVGWAQWSEAVRHATLTPGDDLLAERTVYFEGWAVDALADRLAADDSLRLALPPRRTPAIGADGTWRRGRGPALTAVELAAVRACDGVTSAREIGALLRWHGFPGIGTDADVLRLLDTLERRGALTWRLRLPFETWPERRLRRLVMEVGDAAVRSAAIVAVDRLEAARDAVAASAGSPARLDAALSALEAEFTALTGARPTRAAGQMWAGRTLVFEDCRRDVTARFGSELLRHLSAPLALVLDSASWLTNRIGDHYHNELRRIYARLSPATRGGVPASAMVMELLPHLSGQGLRSLDPIVADFRQRWTRVLALDEGCRRMNLSAACLADRIAAEFPARRPDWFSGGYHSPDVMIAASSLADLARGVYDLVLGEVHLGVNTIDGDAFVLQHPDRDELLRAVEADLLRSGMERFVPLYPKGWPGISSRNYPPPFMRSRRYRYLAFDGNLSDDVPPERVLNLADLRVEEAGSGDGLVVRSPSGEDFDLLAVMGELITGGITKLFGIMPPWRHTPRVTVDRLVVARETWRLPAREIDFAHRPSEIERYVAARALARKLDLPRFVFVRTHEPKPFFLDLTSPGLINFAAAAIRRAGAQDPGRTVTFCEMLPGPDQVWLSDRVGRHYTCELRLVAVQQHEGRSRGPDEGTKP